MVYKWGCVSGRVEYLSRYVLSCIEVLVRVCLASVVENSV